MTNLESIYSGLSNPYILTFLCLVVAFLLSISMYPAIIYLSHKKKLMDEPEDRSMHRFKTPTLGGVGLFITFSLTLILLSIVVGLLRPDLLKVISILGATIILLFLGLKDDLLILSPKKKILGQITAAAFVILFTDIRIHDFHGIFGIGELPYLISVLFTVFVFIFIINAYNLIDGIDGLAGSIAIIASVSFGTYFLINGNSLMILVSFVLIGALLAFLRYNLSNRRKLFMGDSGSLFIGFLLAYQAIYFLTMNDAVTTTYVVKNAPIMVFAVFAFPILDTIRVAIIRIKQKRSPFSADRNHIHHRFLRLGLKHKHTTSLICFTNVLIIAITFLISDLYINLQLLIVCIAFPSLCLLTYFIVRYKGDPIPSILAWPDKLDEEVAEDGVPKPFHIHKFLQGGENGSIADTVDSDYSIIGKHRDKGVHQRHSSSMETKKKRKKKKEVVYKEQPV